jgi:hypothetical protein
MADKAQIDIYGYPWWWIIWQKLESEAGSKKFRKFSLSRLDFGPRTSHRHSHIGGSGRILVGPPTPTLEELDWSIISPANLNFTFLNKQLFTHRYKMNLATLDGHQRPPAGGWNTSKNNKEINQAVNIWFDDMWNI